MATPKIQYARDGDLNLAYQVWGEGPLDIVLVWGLFSHCELFWDDPPMAHFLEELGTFARVVQFDKRGTGMSDAVAGIPTLEQRMDDVRIVTEAVGIDRFVLLGESEGGPMSCLFAATYPDRVDKLILYAPLFSFSARPDFPNAIAPEHIPAWIESLAVQWGEGLLSEFALPSRSGDASARQLCARFERMALTRGAFRQLMQANTEIDIAPVLPSVHVPTIVIHRRDDQLVSADHGRYYAEHIEGAEYAELTGADHYVGVPDWPSLAREIRRFCTGDAGPVGHDVDRVLATVLFTDIVDSTATAASLGDRSWRQLLDDHDRLIAQEVARQRGRVVKSTGDGALAMFDGPARAVRCAESILTGASRLGIQVRAGVHTGEVEMRGEDVGGLGVHIGARVAAAAEPSQVLVSRTVVDLVAGSGLTFAAAGARELKGVPGEWALFAVTA